MKEKKAIKMHLSRHQMRSNSGLGGESDKRSGIQRRAGGRNFKLIWVADQPKKYRSS